MNDSSVRDPNLRDSDRDRGSSRRERGRVVVAAGGGVAATKTPFLLRRLRDAGFEVRAAATDDAFHFVTRMALASAAGGEVLDRDLWFRADGEARHLSWAAWADGLIVAPATADLLASIAHGRADDVVSALALGGVPVLFAPAMNTAMWARPAVQRNVAQLREDGHAFVGPESGALGAVHEAPGLGRMSEPEQIVRAAERWLGPGDLDGLRILVSAGPTRERLDPVRFLSNPSSGKMGYAVAEAALARGADVDLVTGPSVLVPPAGADVEHVESADEMLAALERRYDVCDVLVMTAAVADWRPARAATEKEPKQGETKTMELVRTPDILETLAARTHRPVRIGFAMETDQGVERAADKARRKKLDLVCLNYPTRGGSAFGGDHNEITFVDREGTSTELMRATKRDLADRILDEAIRLRMA